jgi:hypothetical protein
MGAGAPVCVFDAIERLGIEARFVDIPSLEGMYDANSKTIIVSSLRPRGRQAFTAAHELGHHVLRHGHRIDELLEESGATSPQRRSFTPEEFAADCFAGAFLMPKTTVLRGFSERGWKPAACGPNEIYAISGWLGVGYTTLVHHLHQALGLIDEGGFSRLMKYGSRLARVRRDLVGMPCTSNLLFVDAHWSDVAADIAVGDVARFPHGIVEGGCAEIVSNAPAHLIVRGLRQGIARVVCEDRAHFLRISRAGFVGRACFRFEEEILNGD